MIKTGVQVVCTGKEERLVDCSLPESFGEENGDDYSSNGNSDTEETSPAAPGLSAGIASSDCSDDESGRLRVVCRQFEIIGTAQKRKLRLGLLSTICITPEMKNSILPHSQYTEVLHKGCL